MSDLSISSRRSLVKTAGLDLAGLALPTAAFAQSEHGTVNQVAPELEVPQVFSAVVPHMPFGGLPHRWYSLGSAGQSRRLVVFNNLHINIDGLIEHLNQVSEGKL